MGKSNELKRFLSGSGGGGGSLRSRLGTASRWTDTLERPRMKKRQRKKGSTEREGMVPLEISAFT